MSKSTSKPGSSSIPNIPACYTDTHGIITSTTFSIPNHKVTTNLGTIFGLTVRARNWGADLGGFLKSSVGGELGVFTNLMYTARNEAMDRLVGECMGRGGNAVVGVRFDIGCNGPWVQVAAYGTACKVEKVVEEVVQRVEEADEELGV